MNEFKVGLMAIATIISIVYMSLKITSTQSGFGEYIPYRVVVEDASGIFPKTPIKVAGINAGRIVDIELQGNTALLTFEILRRVLVTKGSKLNVRHVGFLGDKYLEIEINDKTEERLNAYALIPSKAQGGFENLTKDASEVLSDIKEITSSLKKALAPDDKESPIKKLMRDVDKIASNAKDITASLKRVVTGNEKKIDQIFANLEQFSVDLRYHLNKDEDQSVVSDIRQVLDNADEMTTDLKDLIADIKKGRGTVGKLLVEEEIADEIKQTMAGVKKMVSKVEAIRTELAISTGVNTVYGGETTAGLTIFPSPERFYLLGVTTSKFGVESEKETRTSINGGAETTHIEKVVKKDTYRFNVQIGRKIHNWSFRGGLIESTGGVGIDYELRRLNTILSLDAFDYRSDLGLNLRLSSEVHLWNVFYGKAAMEDIINRQDSYTFSIGLRFLDEDLKGLLGFFL